MSGITRITAHLVTIVWLLMLATTNAFALTLEGRILQGSLVRGQLPPGSEVRLNGEDVAINEHGQFVLGFSRDENQEQVLKWRLPNQPWQSKRFTLAQRDYRVQRINGLDQKKVTPPESVLQRIRDDAKRVRTARAQLTSLQGFTEQFIWPAEGPITGIYGSQRILNGKPSRPHFGIDVAGPTGEPVVAPASGNVTMADPDLYYSGGTLIIDHGMGLFSTFIHLDSIAVKVGDKVVQGQKIGEVGATGRATGPHLDWRINWFSMRLDPALLVPYREGLDYAQSAALDAVKPSQE